jgi:hypothetical protein
MAGVSYYDIGTERKAFDASSKIISVDPSEALFTVLLLKMEKGETNSLRYDWWDNEIEASSTKINHAAGYAADATDIVVDDASLFLVKDIILNANTMEQMLVTAVTAATNTLTVTRGYGTVTAAAITDNDDIVWMLNAMEENSNAPDSRTSQPTYDYNLVQEIRTPFEGSWWSEGQKLKTAEKERKRQTNIHMVQHRRGLERIFLFGQRKADADEKKQTMSGIYPYIPSDNILDANTDYSGYMTESGWESYCEQIFQYGSDRKLLAASSSLITALNGFASAKMISTDMGMKEFGVAINAWRSPHGTLGIVPSRALGGPFAGMGLVADMKYLKWRPFDGNDTKLVVNIQANDKHGYKDEIWTQGTLEVRGAKSHFLIKGVKSE